MHAGPHLHKRQTAPPNLDGTSVVAGGQPASTSLVLDTGVTPTVPIADLPTQILPPSVTGSSAIPTNLFTDSVSSADPTPTDDTAAAASASRKSQLSIGTVVGVCLGVFLVLSVLILGMIWINNRTRRRLKARKHNLQQQQRWTKMEDGTTEKYKMQVTGSSPSNSGAKKEPSVVRTITVKSSKSINGYGEGLGLANTFGSPPQDDDLSTPRAPFGRSDRNDPFSWGGDTMGGATDSFLTLKSKTESIHEIERAMSPSLVVRKQTPQATHVDSGISRKWAEAELVRPGSEDHESREGEENPFQSPDPFSNDSEVITNVRTASPEPEASTPMPLTPTSMATFGVTSDSGDPMQSLLAALNLTEEQNRLSAMLASQRNGRISNSTFASGYSSDIATVLAFGEDPAEN